MNRVAAVAIALIAVACAAPRQEQRAQPVARSAQAATPAPPRSPAAPGLAEICPMDVPQTTISEDDTANGAAITFKTASGQVDELRRRVRAMAEMHNQHAATAPAPSPGGAGTGAADQAQGPGDHHMGHGHHMMPPPSRANVEDVDGGARVVIVPNDASQADALRAAARMQAMRMQHHGCAMMHGHDQPRG
jgi:hypothetical protein